MNNKIIGTIAIVALVLGVVGLFGGDTEIIKEIREKVGAMPGPDLYVPYLGVNDVRTYPVSQKMTQGTTTPCALRSPTNATSTLTFASAEFTTSSTSATAWSWFKSATMTATTTAWSPVYSITATNKGSAIASSTNLDNSNSITETGYAFAPGEFLVLNVNGGDEGEIDGTTNAVGFKPVGNCVGTFQEIK